MSKIRVGVLRGGPSNEYEVSLKTGDTVLNNLPKNKYSTHDILIAKDGTWHFKGTPKDPSEIFPHIDVAFIALHGDYGEDGQVQRVLDRFNIPYNGSGSFASAIGMNKVHAKDYIKMTNIKVPKHQILSVSENIHNQIITVLRLFGLPVVVKPLIGGSSVGVTIAKTEDQFVEGVRKAFEHSKHVLVEEYIEGREATCGVVESFRLEDLYKLLPVEIIPNINHDFFDYEAKYNGECEEKCPGNFTSEESRELQSIAREVHEKLNLRHYSRSDFIISPRGIYFLEVNTLPGLTSGSLLPKSLKAVGADLPEFLDHIVTISLNN